MTALRLSSHRLSALFYLLVCCIWTLRVNLNVIHDLLLEFSKEKANHGSLITLHVIDDVFSIAHGQKNGRNPLNCQHCPFTI